MIRVRYWGFKSQKIIKKVSFLNGFRCQVLEFTTQVSNIMISEQLEITQVGFGNIND